MATFGERFDRARRQLPSPPSGASVARAVGIGANTFNRWRRMDTEPPVDLILATKIAHVLQCDVREIARKELIDALPPPEPMFPSAEQVYGETERQKKDLTTLTFAVDQVAALVTQLSTLVTVLKQYVEGETDKHR